MFSLMKCHLNAIFGHFIDILSFLFLFSCFPFIWLIYSSLVFMVICVLYFVWSVVAKVSFLLDWKWKIHVWNQVKVSIYSIIDLHYTMITTKLYYYIYIYIYNHYILYSVYIIHTQHHESIALTAYTLSCIEISSQYLVTV